MTSRFRPVTTACSSSSRELRRRSMERMVSALGRATRWTSRPSRDGPRRIEPRLFDDFCRRHGRRRAIGQRPPAVLFDADRHRLVPCAVEVREHRRGRRQRHFVLTGAPAVEHAERGVVSHQKNTGGGSRAEGRGSQVSGPGPGPESRVPSPETSAMLDSSERQFRVPHPEPRRRGAPRRAHDPPRPRADARVHAGRHARRGQVDHAARSRGSRRGDHSRQHLSSVFEAGRRADRPVRRSAPLHRVEPADPDRQRRLPGVQPRGDAPDPRRRGGVPLAHRRLAAHADARARGRHPGPARVGHRHGARRVRGLAGRTRAGARGDGAIGAVGAARARRVTSSSGTIRPPRRTCSSPIPARRSSGSSRAASRPACGPKACRRPSSLGSRPTRSAA